MKHHDKSNTFPTQASDIAELTRRWERAHPGLAEKLDAWAEVELWICDEPRPVRRKSERKQPSGEGALLTSEKAAGASTCPSRSCTPSPFPTSMSAAVGDNIAAMTRPTSPATSNNNESRRHLRHVRLPA
jgi:hypothetical protein